ncbi:hypothetical protein BGW36DRAFT_366325 [Talaromyces proteolyticus]|uniref:Secreted protein n=1 Tax=Talaromyces proteolyticus TaxID=1131652 RepID=A0AAD4L0K8_9EURO|nr:uncharacterized protein BGW36DRAFT_366325 [Talaromyces proteolyticus]KAH8704864.1 hypothetical protein BGW36DRAFT_366325 [Talaromyces proteolyticus]
MMIPFAKLMILHAHFLLMSGSVLAVYIYACNSTIRLSHFSKCRESLTKWIISFIKLMDQEVIPDVFATLRLQVLRIRNKSCPGTPNLSNTSMLVFTTIFKRKPENFPTTQPSTRGMQN